MPVILGSPYYLTCDEMWSGRNGTGWSADGEREYLRRFLVRVKLKEMSEVSVCAAPGIPLPYSFYQSGNGLEYDLAACVVKLRAEQRYDDDWEHWVVSATYSTKLPPGGFPVTPQGDLGQAGAAGSNQGASNNPELEPPDIEWDFETLNQAPFRDLNDRFYENSVHMPLNPAPSVDKAYPVLSMSRNEGGFDREQASLFAYALNDATFLGVPPGCAQCLPPKAKLTYRGRLRYWRVHYRIRFRPIQADGTYIRPDGTQDTWQPEYLDQGMYEWQDDPAHPGQANWRRPGPIIRNGIPVTQNILLDGAGRPKMPTLGGLIEPVYLPFTSYHTADFDDILTYGMA